MLRLNKIRVVIIGGAMLLVSHAAAQQVYFNNFEGPVGPEWSHTQTDTTPIGQRNFLGQFGNGSVTLTLEDLPDHPYAIVSFDLFVLRSWDGNDPTSGYGPDFWDLTARDTATLLHTTFSNEDHSNTPKDWQAYPAWYPHGSYLGYTGAVEQDSLGYFHPMGWREQDAVYHLSFTFPHTDDHLMLDFSASNLQYIGDESWGLDNVSVGLIDLLPARGDLNGDGFVGQADLGIVLQWWGQAVTPGDPLSGDPSGDGSVSQDDLDAVLGDWGHGNLPTNPVPEPATLGMFALCGFALLRRKGKSR